MQVAFDLNRISVQFSAEILRNVATNVRNTANLKVFGQHFAEISPKEVNGAIFGPACRRRYWIMECDLTHLVWYNTTRKIQRALKETGGSSNLVSVSVTVSCGCVHVFHFHMLVISPDEWH